MTIFSSAFADVPLTDQSITERVFAGLIDRPDDVVLTDGPTGRTMTTAAFMDQVKRLAGGLTQAGFGAGHTVALMAPNIPEYCVIFHAVAWAGGTITTLNPTYTAPEIKHQLADSQAELLITIPDFVGTAQEAAGDIGVIAIGSPEFLGLMGDPINAQVPVDLDKHTVVLPYSSGTTGLPKGVMLSHRNLVANCDQIIAAGAFGKARLRQAFCRSSISMV
uniref:AMP-binding protein n=1 Tax=Yoonia rhodophyticola TaxID=3137370 RepID=A0AAN0M991_9RHOB